MLFQWFNDWLERRRRATDWRIVQNWKRETIWTDMNNATGGWTVIVGYENGLGQRKMKIVQKPSWPADPASSLVAEANEWVYEIRPPAGKASLRVIR